MMGILLHLLIVEDSEDDAQLILREIRQGGYEVVWERIETGSAMEQALARKPWDIISCDNSFPQFSALEAMRILKESSLDIPLIIISGTIGEEAAVAALKAGAHDFLVKGKLARLIPAIQRELKEAEGRRERRLEREALRQSEERYRTIFESAAVAILEEDITEVLAMLDFLKAQGVTDFRKYFTEHPESNLKAVRAVKVLNVNQQSLKLFGAVIKTELRHSLDQVFLPETLAMFVEELVTLAEGGQYFEGETAIQTLQGERREVLLTIHFQEPGEKLDHTLVTLIDITERKQAEEQLARSELAHRTLFENVPVGLYRTSADGRILDVNPALVKMFGYKDRKALLAMNIVDLYVNRATDERFKTEVKKSDNISDFEAEYRRLDGTTFWTEDYVRIVRNEASEVLFYEGSLIDITERKRAEELIQRQLKRLNGLRAIDIAISSNSDLHILLDILLLQVVLLLGVDAAAVLLIDPSMPLLEYAASLGLRSNAIHSTQVKIGEGYAGRAVLERKIIHISDLIGADGKLAESLKAANEDFVDYYGVPLIVKGEVKGVLEIYHHTALESDKDWMDFLEVLAGQAAIAIDNAQLFESLQRSKTELEQRVADRTAELNRINAELERANRAKDEFLANMSHELRTPLNSILGLSESLLEQRGGSLNDSQQKSLQIIKASGSHLLELISDILDLSKIEAGKFDCYPQPVSVDDVCRSCLFFVKNQAAQKSIDLNYNNEATVREITADPRRLKQILVNLLTNAVKFTPDNGRVSLVVRADPEQERIQFSIIDTGIGIAPEDLRRLFTPFVQVDSSLNRQFEGTGLGLALTHKLTDLHGGSIQVESEVGKGSHFTVNLPYRPNILKQSDGARTDDGSIVFKDVEGVDFQLAVRGSFTTHHKILLAEDNEANILTVGEYLESYGYEVLVAHDGLEAIDKAQENGPAIILMDIQMPVMGGLEAMQRLRADPRFVSTPIIALTALAMVGDRERCLEAGATEYMSKPVSLKALRKMIATFLTTPK